IKIWAKNLGYSIKKYSNGYYYTKDKVTNRAKNLSTLISKINEEVNPVGNQEKINQMISMWDGFMAYEVD
ncbi:MAG: hypothetical protein ACK55I_17965, partial [bacterium]